MSRIQILWAYEFLYGSVIPLTKLSIIFFYYRLFPVPFFRKVLYFVLFLVIGWWIAIIVVAIFQCRPYSYFWNQYVDPTATGKCINIESFFIGNGAASVVTDFIILMTPIPMVWRLQMPVMQRLSVLGIFFLGGLYVSIPFYYIFSNRMAISSVCIAGVIRLYVLTKMFQSADLTWNMSQAFIWSSVEPNIGIVCACLPTLRPLIRQCLPRWFGGSGITPSSQPGYGTDHSRHRSQNGDFYALRDRGKDPQKDKSDDELGLTNDFKSDHHRQPQDSTEDGIALENHNAIIVKRDIEWSSTSVSS